MIEQPEPPDTTPEEAAPEEAATYWEVDCALAPETEELWALFCYARGATGAQTLAEAPPRLVVRFFFDKVAPAAAEKWPAEFRREFPHLPPPERFRLRRRPVEDWGSAWRAYFRPLPIGKTLLVCPPWEVPGPAEGLVPSETEGPVLSEASGFGGRLPVIIRPGQGFGTGSHPSTALALEMLEGALQREPTPARLLDVGMGSGILAATAGLLGVRRIFGLDIEWAVMAEVRHNFRLNRLAAPSGLVRGRADCLRGEFDLVVANISAAVFLEDGRDLRRLTAAGGELILSGMLNEEAPEVSRTFKGEGFAVIESAERAGWSALRFRRSNPPGR